jgi:hypothetical protein
MNPKNYGLKYYNIRAQNETNYYSITGSSKFNDEIMLNTSTELKDFVPFVADLYTFGCMSNVQNSLG